MVSPDSTLSEEQYETLFKNIFSNAPVGLGHMNPDGQLIRANPAFCSMVGYDEDELRNMSYETLTHPEDIEKERLLLKEMLDGTRNHFTIKKRYVRKDMSILWAKKTMIRPNRDGTEPGPLVCFVQDITEQIHAERESEKLSTIVEIQRDIALSELDLEKTINEVAEAAMTVTGGNGAAVQLAENGEMIYRGTSGILEEFLGQSLPIEDSLSGQSYQQDEIIICHDTQTDERINESDFRPDINFRSALFVPLSYENTTFGILKVASEVPFFFEDDDRDTIELLSGLLSSQIYQSLKFQDTLLEARTDELTGLANRRRIMENLSQEIDRAERYDHDLSLILLDLDHFKLINDDHGHVVGDQVLRQVGTLLSEEIRTSDAVGRYGGEEFIIVTPEVGAEEAAELAERIRSSLSQIEFEGTEEDEIFKVTCSAGVASYHESLSPKTLISRADQAMYYAKEQGRNQVRLFSEAPEELRTDGDSTTQNT